MKPNTIRLIDLLSLSNVEDISIAHAILPHKVTSICCFRFSELSNDLIEQWKDVFNSRVMFFNMDNNDYSKTLWVYVDDCDSWRIEEFGFYFENKF